MLKVNDVAPLFTLKDQNGHEVSLNSFRGQKVIVYFYPKDFTGGCTLQAQSFAASYGEFQKLGYVVLGISKDDVASHQEFCSRYALPFTLLSDPSRETIVDYGVDKPITMFGDIAIDSKRMTFVINEDGLISHIFPDVDPKNSTLELLKLLKK